MKNTHSVSLSTVMILLVIFCWLIPIAAVSIIFGTLLSRNYMESQQASIETTV